MRVWRALVLLLLTACAHRAQIREDFQVRLDDMLSEPPPLPAGWPADGSAWIAHDVVRATINAAVRDLVLTRTFSLAGMSASPRLTVADLKVGPPTTACADCVSLVARLDGDVGFLAFGTSTEIGVRATVTLDASVNVVPFEGALSLVARPLRVHDVRVAWDGAPAWAISALPLPMLTTWLSEKALTTFQPVTVARFGENGLPIRALRVTAAPGGLRLEARSAAYQALAVGAVAQPDRGWAVRVPVETVLQLARRQLFQQGPVDHDVWIDPIALRLGDDTFSLRVRLWRVVGAPWWREIDVRGSLSVNRQKIVLRADDAIELGHSNGAGLADPLVALAKGRVLDAIANAATISVPTTQAASLGGTASAWRIHELWIDGTDLVLSGDATFTEPPRP